MLAVRVIPCLDVQDGRVVKGVRFRDLRDAGDPVELAKLYNDQGADEIVFLDIAATPRSRRTVLDIVEKVSRQVFVPLTVGGGVRSLGDVRLLLGAGADKVAICSAALDRPELIAEAAGTVGSQCVVLSIDAKARGEAAWTAYRSGGREDTGVDALDWARRGQALGAGEILLNSIDRDGTKSGFDLELIRAVKAAVSIPVIASSGAGTPEHFAEVFDNTSVEAALAAGIFHRREVPIAAVKNHLRARGIETR
jgi:cyclase